MSYQDKPWRKLWRELARCPKIRKAHRDDGNGDCAAVWTFCILDCEEVYADVAIALQRRCSNGDATTIRALQDGRMTVAGVPCTASDIADGCAVPVESVDRQLDRFVAWGWMDVRENAWYITNYAEKQEGDSTVRSAVCRAKKALQQRPMQRCGNGDATPLATTEAEAEAENRTPPKPPKGGGTVRKSSRRRGPPIFDRTLYANHCPNRCAGGLVTCTDGTSERLLACTCERGEAEECERHPRLGTQAAEGWKPVEMEEYDA